MLTKLMEGVGDKLADKWIASLLTPAFLFWAGGLLAWISKIGWETMEKWLLVRLKLLATLRIMRVARCYNSAEPRCLFMKD